MHHAPRPPLHVAFASMCVRISVKSDYHVIGSRDAPGAGPWVFYQRCAASLCSLLKWPAVRELPVLYLVDDALPLWLRRAARFQGVSLLNVSGAASDWPSTPRYPHAPPRAYSFHKFALWRLGAYFERIVFFDADVFFVRDPGPLLQLTSSDADALWAVRMPAPPSKWKAHQDQALGRYFNSGLMVFRPTDETYQLIMRAWRTDGYKLYAADENDVGDQDLLIEVYTINSTNKATRLRALPSCAHFRTAKRDYQRRCLEPEGLKERVIVHGTYHFGPSEKAAGWKLFRSGTKCNAEGPLPSGRPRFAGSIDVVRPGPRSVRVRLTSH